MIQTNYIKMHGLYNTFIVFKGPLKIKPEQVKVLCADSSVDGCLVVSKAGDQLIRMKYWNSDGSIAEMCGNGLRCAVRFAVDNGLVKAGDIEVQTGAGLLKARWYGVNPDFIEVQVGVARSTANHAIEGAKYYSVDVGNPHAVTFVGSVDNVDVKKLGPKVENAAEYAPTKTNVEFVEVGGKHNIRMRVWERGVGETQACGTGMVAAAKVAVDQLGTEYPVNVTVPGGTAKVWVDSDGYSRLIGPAVVMGDQL
jgi:diaminopimelate epimerase